MRNSQKKFDEKWERVEENTLYPDSIKVFDLPIRGLSDPKRQVQKDSIGKSGSFLCKKLKREVFYESDQERKIYKILSGAMRVKWYQEQPAQLEYLWGSTRYPHCPDVIAVTDEGHCRIIEVKTLQGLLELKTIKKAFVSLDNFHWKGIGYNLIAGNRTSLADLARVTFPDAMLDLLSLINKRGFLDYEDRKEKKEEIGFSNAQLYSFMIKHDLAFESSFGHKISRLPYDLNYERLLKKGAS